MMTSLDALLRSAYEVDPRLTYMMENTFFRVTLLLESDEVPLKKKQLMLKQLNVYLQKKCTELDPMQVEARDADLRKIRNSLAHGKNNFDTNVSLLYEDLWRAISHLADRLEPYEMENLLAYTLGVENIKAATRGVSGSTVVSIYERVFLSLKPEKQRKVFSELLLSLFSDPESLALLSKDLKK